MGGCVDRAGWSPERQWQYAESQKRVDDLTREIARLKAKVIEADVTIEYFERELAEVRAEVERFRAAFEAPTLAASPRKPYGPLPEPPKEG